MRYCFFVFIFFCSSSTFAQSQSGTVKTVPHTPVKNQDNTGTCWSFSTISLIESQGMKTGIGEYDLSEMFIVRNIYKDKARKYLLRQGATQFGPGGLGHDVINAVEQYGAVPESVYSGLLLGEKKHNHKSLDAKLKSYLDSLLKFRPIPQNWMVTFERIMDDHLGKVPETFTYNEKTYNPKSFARDVLKFKRDDYVFITSFTHHPFFSKFILEIPDNYSNEAYFNIPLEDMLTLVESAVSRGYSVMWDADVSNTNFRQKDGYALQWKDPKAATKAIDPDVEESSYNQEMRQQLFENLTTQDDHLMHLVGVEKTTKGKKLFVIKNSWGEIGPFKGLIKVSMPYFAINTVSLVIPKAALEAPLRAKLQLQ